MTDPMSRLPLIYLWLFFLILAGCAGGGNNSAASPAKADYTADEDAWVDSVISRMTVREMAGQMIMPAVYSDSASLPLVRFYADSLHIGGIMLLQGKAEGARLIRDSLSSVSDVIPFVGIDAEWGLGMRIHDAPSFPRNGHISPQADASLMYDYGRETGRHARAIGVNMIFGPVLDVVSESGKDVIGTRSLGSDPGRVGTLGSAYARGLEDEGIISVAKHFPGHGEARTDSHKDLPVIPLSRVRLEKRSLLPFRMFIEEGLSGMMIGHLYMPALDSVMRPAAVSPVVIRELLRDEMGFRGLVVTDALNMGAVSSEHFPVRDALLAGADIILAPGDTERAFCEILEAVDSGTLPRATLEESCRRILHAKFRLMQRYGVLRYAEGIFLRGGETDRLQRMLSGEAGND